MYFHALGTFEVSHEGRSLTPTAPKQRSVLALLAMHRGGLVPISTLIEEIWPSDPPASAVTTLQTYIYQLRRTLSEATGGNKDLLVTKPLGYVANIPAEDIDVHRFNELVGAGKKELANENPEEGSKLLREATGLWTGKALCDVHCGPLLQAHAARLEESKLQALLMRAEADLRLGRHQELVGELSALVARHPWHEGFSAKLIIALYRCDRRSQALDVYHEVRRGLHGELGIDPSPNLQKLYQAVLSDAPHLQFDPLPETAAVTRRGAAAVPPAQLPADLPDFHGREGQLAELDRLLNPEHCAPQVLTISGMPGVGKTALAMHAAHVARSRFPDAQLYTRLGGSTDQPVGPVEVLRGFLADLGEDIGQLPAEQEVLARTFRTRVASMKGLLVIDDARGAEQVRPLLPGGRHWSVIVTGRCLEGALPGAHDVVAEPLTCDEGVDLLADMLGDRRVRLALSDAAAIVAHCGGLPAALRALGRRLAVNRHWTMGKLAARVGEDTGLLTELHEAGLDLRGYLQRGFDDLAPGDREALFVLGRAGDERFDVSTAASLLDTDACAAEDTLDRLTAVHLLHAVPAGPPQEVQYVLHPLLRTTLTPAQPRSVLGPRILPVRPPAASAALTKRPGTVHVAG